MISSSRRFPAERDPACAISEGGETATLQKEACMKGLNCFKMSFLVILIGVVLASSAYAEKITLSTIIPSSIGSSGFGAWDSSRSFGVTYTADTDGFVIVCCFPYMASTAIGYVNGTPILYAFSNPSSSSCSSFTMPVRKGDSWEAAGTGGCTLRWLPLGS